MRRFKVLDLFAGGGGFSTGFLNARFKDSGFDIVLANEIDPTAATTLRKHLGPEKVLQGDITDEKIRGEIIERSKQAGVDVIIGGPPCQTFSMAGPARSGTVERRLALRNDPRNVLYKYFFEIVEKVKPQFVVFENVEGILSKELETDELTKVGRNAIEVICDELEAIGYHLNLEGRIADRHQILNAADYGVAQQRKRVIIIANLSGVPNPIPIKTHGIENSPHRTVSDELKDLPIVFPKISVRNLGKLKNNHLILNNVSKGIMVFIDQVSELFGRYEDERFGIAPERLSEFKRFIGTSMKKFRNKKKVEQETLMEFIKAYNKCVDHKHSELENPNRTWHSSREHNLRDIAIFCNMIQGTSSASFMREGSEAYDKYLDDLYPYNRNKHKDTYVKHAWSKPSNTILSHMEKDGLKFIHPEQPRTFTPYEAALIQSFPPDYCFSGGRNAQYRQIGNAVPPKLAQSIGEAILKTMENHKISPNVHEMVEK